MNVEDKHLFNVLCCGRYPEIVSEENPPRLGLGYGLGLGLGLGVGVGAGPPPIIFKVKILHDYREE